MISIDSISEFLTKYDIKPSYQRIKVFEYLTGNKSHPTVDSIYQALSKEIPTLSKTTVYNTLKLFHEKGIVLVIGIETNELRYDAITDTHGHFKCTKCGELYDFKMDVQQLETENMKDFQISEHHIYLKGICKNCI